jgi:hypothetical protein
MLGCRRKQDVAPPLPPVVPAENLRETDVLPHTLGKITPGRNYVYCAAFQLAWNTLQRDVFGEPIRLSGSPQMAADLQQATKLRDEDFPPGAYLVKAGWVRDGIVDQIRKEMNERFPKAAFRVPEGGNPQAAVVYAYLQRSLPFREAFNLFDEVLTFKSKAGDSRVVVFGFYRLRHSPRDSALRSQVTVLSHVDNDNFVLRLNTAVEDDELVLAKVAPEKTLQATLNGVLRRAASATGKDRSAWVEDNEPLVVPVINVGVIRRYTDLESRAFQNPKWSGLDLSIASQGIRFRLDETGARLESDAYIEAKDAALPEPRKFIFDKPFLVYLKRRSSEVPYFALWVETAEVLEKYDE